MFALQRIPMVGLALPDPTVYPTSALAGSVLGSQKVQAAR